MKKEIKTEPIITLIIVGGSCDGKTCLWRAFKGLKFDGRVTPTIGVDFFIKKMIMSDGIEVKIQIWDTAGNKRFRNILLSYLRGSNGVIVVFDVTDKESFRIVDYWLEKIRSYSKDMPIVLFGSKCDLEEERTVNKEKVQEYADKNGILYFETSAKKNIGIKEGFEAICEIVR